MAVILYLLTGILLMFNVGCSNISTSTTYHHGHWRAWLSDLRKDAIAQDIKPELFDRIFNDISPQLKLIRLDHKQATGKGNYYIYLKKRGDAIRIKLGRQEYQQYQALLNKIGNEYQVDPCYIIAILGIETVYGRYTGNYPVITSLATLAYDGRRGDFFRKELIYALKIINDGHKPENNFKGAWDGGMGQPQFMPSSWHTYAVDYDGDGRKDIWNAKADIYASVANYLQKNGWQPNQPYSLEVILPHGFNPSLCDMQIIKPVKEWLKLGVKIKSGQAPVNINLPASLKQLSGGPTILVFNNFKTILTYNKSPFYAGTVGYLAKHICHKY